MKVLITQGYVLQSRVFKRGAVIEPTEEIRKTLLNAGVAKEIETAETAARKLFPETTKRKRKKR